MLLRPVFLLEARPAKHRPALRGLEWDRGLRAALRTGQAGLRANPGAAAGALRLALFAVPGVILELFVVEEKLFAGRENKLGATIDALENSIGKLHDRLPHWQGSTLKSAMTNRKDSPVPFPCLSTSFFYQGPGRNKFSGK